MAEPAFIVMAATASGAGRCDAPAGARRPGHQARLHWLAEAPLGRLRAEPEAGVDATDHTAFSMIGVAG